MRVDIKKYNQFMCDNYFQMTGQRSDINRWEYEAGEIGEFWQGDIIYSTVHENVGVVLGVIGWGECRTDSDGMQDMSKLRLATLEEIENSYCLSFRNYIQQHGFETLKTDLWLVSLDSFYDPEFLSVHGISRVYDVYLVDKSQVTYPCEVRPHYFLRYAYSTIEPTEEFNHQSWEAIDNGIIEQDDIYVSIHKAFVEEIKLPDHEIQDNYDEIIDEALEYVRANRYI